MAHLLCACFCKMLGGSGYLIRVTKHKKLIVLLINETVFNFDNRLNSMFFIIPLCIAVLLTLFSILQTTFFIQPFCSFYRGISDDSIHNHVTESKKMQQSLFELTRANDDIVQLEVKQQFFHQSVQLPQLNNIINYLLDNDPIKKPFNEFDFSISSAHVVIVDMDKMQNSGDRIQAGLTPAAWKIFENTIKSTLKGLTIRERPEFKKYKENTELAIPLSGIENVKSQSFIDGAPTMTEDGRPRILLSHWAFESEESLKLTITHELLHANNMPACSAFFIQFQDDLMYSSHYQVMLRENDWLGNFTFRQQNKLAWVLFAASLIGSIFGFCLIPSLIKNKTQLRYDSAIPC
jgi:hypothetical protein